VESSSRPTPALTPTSSREERSQRCGRCGPRMFRILCPGREITRSFRRGRKTTTAASAFLQSRNPVTKQERRHQSNREGFVSFGLKNPDLVKARGCEATAAIAPPPCPRIWYTTWAGKNHPDRPS